MLKRLAALLVVAMIGSMSLTGAHADPTIIRSYISSFDATKIVYNLFLPADATAANPVPIIFQTHGWGGAGQASYDGFLKTLVDNDYAVITWDQRGFGQSGGDAYVDDPGHEVRDASALIDLVARRSDIQHQAPNDPVMGMIGGSYAGGIQLALAAFDSRVDAIIPQITWHDLDYSLFPGGVQKLGFDELLYGSGLATAASAGLGVTVGVGTKPSVQTAIPPTAGFETGNYSTDLHEIEVRGTAHGYADQDTLDWFRGRSMAGYDFGHPVRVPTMLEQGSTDALFNVNEAVQNLNDIAATGAPVKLILFCGGHVACPGNYNQGTQGAYIAQRQLDWFAKYLRGENVDTGATVDYVTNDGVIHSTSAFGADATSSTTVHGAASLVSSGAKTSETNGAGAQAGLSGIEAATPSDPNDPGTLTIDTGIEGGQSIVGIPTVTLNVAGVGDGAHLFFKLVDRDQNQVIDLQEAALRVENLSTPQTITLDMVGVAYKVPADHHIDLQVSTSSSAMSEYRGPAVVDVDVTVSIPLL
ncbi:MAG: alpha/beta fold hydrolase [Actinomycetota bacterium]